MPGISYADPLTGFTAFMAETGPAWVTGKTHFANAMARNNYPALFWMMRGRRMSDLFSGGSDIRDRTKFDLSNNSRGYRLGEAQFATIQQEGKTFIEYWRFQMHGDAWQEETMVLNAGANMNAPARAESYKSQWTNFFMNLHTSIVEYYDHSIWAKPDYDLMEGVDARDIKSIPVYINEFPNGLFNQGTANGGPWTTIHGVNPATVTRYRPYQGTYGPPDPLTAGSSTTGFAVGHPGNVIFALDVAVEKTRFKAPPMYQESFDPDSEGFLAESGYLATSLWGRTLLKATYRNSQDRWDNENDPYGNPLFSGIPVVWVDALNRAPLYANGDLTSTTWEGAVGPGGVGGVTATDVRRYGPRFYGITPSTMRLIFHPDRYMEKIGPIRSEALLTRWSLYYNTFAAMFCADRRKSFIISPQVDQTGIRTAILTAPTDSPALPPAP